MDNELIDLFKADPYANLLTMTLHECKKGYAEVRLTVTERMLNFHGFAHGGLIFSLADYAFAAASNSHGRTAVGLNVHMSYLAPGKIGDELVCIATETKRTPKIALYDMKTRLSTGELIATMEGMVYIKEEQFMNGKASEAGQADG